MRPITLSAAALGGVLAAAPVAHAQDLTRQTSCAEMIAINRAGAAGADVHGQAQGLLAIIAPYLPPSDQPPQAQPMLRVLMTLTGFWCGNHPQDSVGTAVDQAARLEHLTAREDIQPPDMPVITALPPPASAPPDEATIARLTLFRQTCLNLPGAGPLRAWAVANHGIPLPDAQLPQVTHGQPAKLFDMRAVMPDTILISIDSGACAILTHGGELARYETAMEHVTWGPGATFAVTQDMRSPQNDSVVRNYDLETPDWGQVVSVGGNTVATGPPIVMLMAMPRRQAI